VVGHHQIDSVHLDDARELVVLLVVSKQCLLVLWLR
jgi:hypothetical protein